MDSLSTLNQYLKQQGVTADTSAEIYVKHKKEYAKLYHKHYYAKRKNNEKRFSLRLNKQEHKRLKKHAERHGDKNMGVFIKEAALAYLEQNYIPRDEETIDLLQKEVRKIGNNINQVVHHFHRKVKFETPPPTAQDAQEYELQQLKAHYEILVKEVSGLNDRIVSYFTTPTQKLTEVLVEVITDDPNKISLLKDFLDEVGEG